MMHKTAHKWLNMTIYSMENYLQMPGKKKLKKSSACNFVTLCMYLKHNVFLFHKPVIRQVC